MGIIYFEDYAYLLHLKLFRTVYSWVLIQEKIAKYTWEENGVYSGNVETIAISEIYEVSIIVGQLWPKKMYLSCSLVK
jgi:hypothetical protein